MNKGLILGIDQGTSSSRVFLFDAQGKVLKQARRPLQSQYPQDGWVEQDGEQILQTVRECLMEVLSSLSAEDVIAGAGITNQRETVLIWERSSGKPIAPAIVWQDRRTQDRCQALKDLGVEGDIIQKTGLCIDPYFSATKIAWLLDKTPGARARAEKGEIVCGTVDSFLLWHLTEGQHQTDATNACRTQLWNIHEQCWDEELCGLFRVPMNILPEVRHCVDDYGVASPFGHSFAIRALIGDQQASLVGQGGLTPGAAKTTYGTGAFMMVNTGAEASFSEAGLLTTVALSVQDNITYALEGSIFSAGSVVQWCRDNLSLVATSADTESVAHADGDARGVWFIPAFTGLGAPWWRPEARAAILGLTRDSSKSDIVTAALQSVCLQTRDLTLSLEADGIGMAQMAIDGGMATNAWFAQHLADVLQMEICRPHTPECTVEGVLQLARLGSGLIESLPSPKIKDSFYPVWPAEKGQALHRNWRQMVSAIPETS